MTQRTSSSHTNVDPKRDFFEGIRRAPRVNLESGLR